MNRYIDADVLLDTVFEVHCKECDKRKGKKNGKYKTIYEVGEAPCKSCGVNDMREYLEDAPTADVVEVVRCKDCKHRIVNEHYGEKGYMKLKAICDKDTGDPFELGRNAEDDEWFCADAERRTE